MLNINPELMRFYIFIQNFKLNELGNPKFLSSGDEKMSVQEMLVNQVR